jgi:hypothetical protein
MEALHVVDLDTRSISVCISFWKANRITRGRVTRVNQAEQKWLMQKGVFKGYLA